MQPTGKGEAKSQSLKSQFSCHAPDTALLLSLLLRLWYQRLHSSSVKRSLESSRTNPKRTAKRQARGCELQEKRQPLIAENRAIRERYLEQKQVTLHMYFADYLALLVAPDSFKVPVPGVCWKYVAAFHCICSSFQRKSPFHGNSKLSL